MNSFYDSARPGSVIKVGTTSVELPILYQRDDHFALMYTADLKKTQDFMPAKSLHPVVMPNGRALVSVAAFNFHETTIGSYGEIGVVIFVVHGGKPLPLIPALMESRYAGFGSIVLHLPVTKIIARDSGRGIWGYPKFCTDMEFTIKPEYKQVELAEKRAAYSYNACAEQGRAKQGNKGYGDLYGKR